MVSILSRRSVMLRNFVQCVASRSIGRRQIVKYGRRRVSAAAFVFLSIGLASGFIGSAAAQNANQNTAQAVVNDAEGFAVRDERDLVLLQVVLDQRLRLSEALPAYYPLETEQLFVPLGELAATLSFSLFVDPDAGRVEGFFIDEGRTFILDLPSRSIEVSGNARPYPEVGIERHRDDIYVRKDIFESWFPVKLELNFRRQQLNVVPLEALPIQGRIARARLAQSLNARGGGALGSILPRRDIPYKLLDMPFTDLRLEAEYDSEQDRKEREKIDFDLSMQGDFLFLNGSLFLSGDTTEGPTTGRIRLGRKDPDGTLLGPAHATEFDLGDVFTPRIPLLSGSGEGRGVTITNRPLAISRDFDVTEIRGDATPGFDVELYRNNALLETQIVQGDGRYEFLDVPLVVGLNEFRIEIYGTEGQRQTVLRSVLVGPGLIKPGEQHYSVTVNQEDEDTLFFVEEDQGNSLEQGKLRAFAEYQVGVTKALSVGASAATFALESGKEAAFGGVNALFIYGPVFGRAMAFADQDGDVAALASFQTRFGGVNMFGEHRQFFGDFVSEDNEVGANAGNARDALTALRFDGFISSGFEESFRGVSYSFGVEHETFRDAREESRITSRLSTSVDRLTLTNNLRLERTDSGVGAIARSADGDFLASTSVRGVSMRGGISYDLKPETEFTSSFLGLDTLIEEYFLTTRYDHDFDDSTDRFFAGLSRNFGAFDAGFNAEYDNGDGSYRAGVFFRIAFDREPRTGALRFGRDANSRSGAASVRVFNDLNGDGAFDDGDEPVEGVEITRDSRGSFAGGTDSEGIAVVGPLSTTQATGVSIDRDGVPDPFLRPTLEGVSIVARPGVFAALDFPLRQTGEIEGYVRQVRNDQDVPAGNVIVELVDGEGRVVSTARSQFDGLYLLDAVLPGVYTVRINQEQIDRLGFKTTPEQNVEIPPDGDLIQDIDFTIVRSARASSARPFPRDLAIGQLQLNIETSGVRF